VVFGRLFAQKCIDDSVALSHAVGTRTERNQPGFVADSPRPIVIEAE